MRKIKLTILSLLTLTAAISLTAAGLCAQNTTASAESATLGEKLLPPVSYEEYLPLVSPSDVAATDGYVAIADRNTLFVFNRDKGIWQSYVHENSVTKLHFGSRDELYFLDGQTNALYKLNANALASPADTGVVCSTFSIHGDTLYYANTSAGTTSIYHAPLADLSAKSEPFEVKTYSSAISFWNGEIYYVYGTDYLHKLNPETNKSESVADLPSGVVSMTISQDTVFCATQDGGFYGYALTDLSTAQKVSECTPVAELIGGYSAVSANGGDIYLVRGNTVQKFSMPLKKLTDYEIGASSDSLHRFHGASEAFLSGDTLFIADDGNDRISVYDVKENTFQEPINSTMDTPFLLSYGETLLTATATQAIVYSLNADGYGETLSTLSPDKISGNIVGAASVYGSYYLVTDTNYCYTLTENETGYVWTETLRKSHQAEQLASDANGFLYILNDGAIYRYTEKNFTAPTEEGVKICENIPAATTKLSVDYAGNLYALAENSLYRYSQTDGAYALHSATPLGDPLVYGATPNARSFAFGIEENAVYLLYENDYLTVTDEFELSTVKTIPTENAANGVFGKGVGEFSVVQTLEKSLLVEIDLNKLDGASEFPYLRYYRSETPITGLKIGETADYAVLSFRENAASAYKTVLVAKDRQTELENSYERITKTNGYLTNAARAYKFPSMGLPALGEFEKGEKITLLGKINGLDCEYYAVAYGESTAYVPKSHVTLFNGAPPTTETVKIEDVNADKEAIWRLAYLLLGTGAICVLVDFLILRKKDKDE